MKKVCLSLITILFFAAGSVAQTVVVTGADAATNAGSPYATLKAAFDNINLSLQGGNVIVITVTGVTTETASAALNQSAWPWTSLKIIPSGAAQITGNIAGHLIDLNGADNVTIDGLNSGGNSLAINNSNAGNGSSTIRFFNDATNNTLTKVNLLGSAGNALGIGFGVVYFSTGSLTGNDNNTINQCSISASSGGTPLNGIYSLGSSAAVDNSNNNITTNNISDYFNAGAASNGMNINSGNSAWTITNNTFYQTATRIATTGSLHNGIFITSGSGYTISNNVIGFAAPNATGTTNIIGLNSGSLGGSFPAAFTAGGVSNSTRFAGINCTFTTGGAFSSIQNNTIGGIAIYSSGVSTTLGTLCGIVVQGGNANIGTVTGNTIGVASGTSSLYAANTAAGGVISGIYCTTTNSINIQNNTIGGIDVSGTTATTAAGFKGIEIAGSGTYSVTSNNVGNTTPNNIRTGYLLTGGNLSNAATTPTGASGTSLTQGIVNTSTGSILDITNNLLHGLQVSGTATTYNGIINSGAVTGTINLNNNQLGNIDAGAVNFSASTTGFIRGIVNTSGVATTTVNMNNNSVEGISAVACAQLAGIINTGSASPGVAVNILNNRLGSATANFATFTGATAGFVYGFVIDGGVSTTIKSMNNNDIRGIVHNVTASCNHAYFYASPAGTSSNINDNTFTNLSVNTTGTVYFFYDAVNLPATGVKNCNNNRIVTAFNKTAAGGNVYFYYSTANSVNGSVLNQTGNDFSNVTVTGATVLYGLLNWDGASSSDGPTKTITGNTFTNLTGGSSNIYAMNIDFSGINSTVSSNTISNINGTGNVYGILHNSSNNQGTHQIASNTVSNLNSTGTGGNVYGIVAGAPTIPTLNISSNTVSGLATSGASSNAFGLLIVQGGTVNVNANNIYTISGSGATSPQASGITVSDGSTVNLGYNTIYSISETAALSATSPAVTGISITGGLTVTAYNNFISDLKAPNANLTDAVRGVNITSTTASAAYNLYYNSIYLNASSSGTNFGTSGIFHTTSTTSTTAALNMIDNIVVNTSTANGTGVTAAYRRSDATLTNFAATSDYNLLYAGTPSATKLIYYDGTNSDQTLTAYQTRVSARDANAVSLMPTFISATNLHLNPGGNCQLEGRGTPVPGITTDIDVQTRNASTPDIGADEFTAVLPLEDAPAGSAGTALCENRDVSPAGTTYRSNLGCGLIARVAPAGADPVTGKIQACVTLDATQQYFNGEPYVQRHFDIEPAAANQSTTSATVTLYFLDSEFQLYNTNNPVWPPLPTEAGGGSSDPNRANLKVTQFHGVANTSPSSPGNYPGAAVLIDPVDADIVWNPIGFGYWQVTFNVTGFSGFYVHTNNFNAPLPIVVNYLTGRRQGSNHLLNWKVTCASTPRATMTLERSSDGRTYTGINTITADAARCNSPFDYTDMSPLPGMNYYRLKIVDADGHITYSTIVALLNALKGFDIISIAPNPVVADKLNLNIASAQAGKMELSIFDMQGRLVSLQNSSLVAGFNSLPVNVTALPAGTYSIRAAMAGEQVKTRRFVKQ